MKNNSHKQVIYYGGRRAGKTYFAYLQYLIDNNLNPDQIVKALDSFVANKSNQHGKK